MPKKPELYMSDNLKSLKSRSEFPECRINLCPAFEKKIYGGKQLRAHKVQRRFFASRSFLLSSYSGRKKVLWYFQNFDVSRRFVAPCSSIRSCIFSTEFLKSWHKNQLFECIYRYVWHSCGLRRCIADRRSEIQVFPKKMSFKPCFQLLLMATGGKHKQ